jgi:hypothetical protein
VVGIMEIAEEATPDGKHCRLRSSSKTLI